MMFHFVQSEKSANWCRCFYVCENYWILWRVLVCVVRNVSLLHLRCALIFSVSYVIPLCPYFLKRFCALLDCFFMPKPSLFTLLFVAGFPWCHFLGLRDFPLQILLLVVVRAFFMHPFGNDNLVCGVC